MKSMSVRSYAIKEGVSLGTVYRRLWEGRIDATKRDGRWLILPSASGGANADSVGGCEVRRSATTDCGGPTALQPERC